VIGLRRNRRRYGGFRHPPPEHSGRDRTFSTPNYPLSLHACRAGNRTRASDSSWLRCRVARSSVYTLLARYQAEGEAAFELRPSPMAVGEEVVELVVRLRKELSGRGLDAWPHPPGSRPRVRSPAMANRAGRYQYRLRARANWLAKDGSMLLGWSQSPHEGRPYIRKPK